MTGRRDPAGGRSRAVRHVACVLAVVAVLAACERLRLEGQGGSKSEPEFGLTLQL